MLFGFVGGPFFLLLLMLLLLMSGLVIGCEKAIRHNKASRHKDIVISVYLRHTMSLNSTACTP